jgi:cyclophilin family peptidyl-prolyl cis-trans isomerase
MKSAVYLNMNTFKEATPQFLGKLRFRYAFENKWCKEIVKQIVYALLFVQVALLFSSCNEINRFENNDLIQIRSFGDQRDLGGVLSYFENSSAELRAQAALEFSSFHDSTAIAPLLKLAEFDEEATVRAAAAFSLGQFRTSGLKNLLLRLLKNEENDEVIHQLIIAAGKSSATDELIKITESKLKTSNVYEGLFYASVVGADLDKSKQFLVEGLSNKDEKNAFYASAALVRSKLNLNSNVEDLLKAFKNSKNSDLQYNLSILIGRACAKNLSLVETFRAHESYLAKVGFLRGLQLFSDSLNYNLLFPFLADSVHHVREEMAVLLNNSRGFKDVDLLLKAANSEKYSRIKYLLFEACLRNSRSEVEIQRISEQLALDYARIKDEYSQGFILKALCGSELNFDFVDNKSFSTESIIVRGAGVDALIQSMPNTRSFNQKSYSELLRKSLLTYDVALCSMAALGMRDTTKYVSLSKQDDIAMLQEVLSRMRLPRDMETYSDLFITMQKFMGNDLTSPLKPEFNHPIDWQLAGRIADDLQVEIQTERGNIIVELWVDKAPGTVTNFVSLIQDSFFVNKRLHRVVPGFVIQDGCPRGDGYGSIMNTIRSEFAPDAMFEAGTIGMASAGEDTESCQWFITHVNTPHLNGRYTAFGKVVNGMKVVHQLSLGDRIFRIKILPKPIFD